MGARFNGLLRTVLLASRWAMAPLCLGLIAALLIVLGQFFRDLAHAVVGFPAMGTAEVILAVLKLVDLMLVANLVLMLIEAAVEIFLPPAATQSTAPTCASGTAPNTPACARCAPR